MRSASRSVTMTRRSHPGQGRKSRLLAKLASPGGTLARRARPFRPSVTGSGDIGICPGDGPDPAVPCRSDVRAQGGSAACRCRKGAGEGGLASPVPRPNRGDHGQDRSKSRRKAHVRRGARHRRSGAGRLRARQAAAGAAAGAAADLHSEPDQPGRSGRSGRACTHGTGLHADLPARPGAAAGHEGAAGRSPDPTEPGVRADLSALDRGREPGSLRTGAATLHPDPDSMPSRAWRSRIA